MSSLTSTYKVGKGVFTPTTLGSDDTLLIIKPGKRRNVKQNKFKSNTKAFDSPLIMSPLLHTQ